jgi:hypothetical protein
MTILGLILIFTLMAALEVPRLVRDKMWREMTAFSGLLIIGMVLSFAHVLNINLPNPTHLLYAIFRPMTEVIMTLLK